MLLLAYINIMCIFTHTLSLKKMCFSLLGFITNVLLKKCAVSFRVYPSREEHFFYKPRKREEYFLINP
jgi:hypothetical protein